MKHSIYKYLDYRKYILDLLKECPRGERKRLSHSLSCQMAFITHVLSDDKDFNHEQILRVAEHFHLTESEREYLLDLLSFNRAGTTGLATLYKARLEAKREHNKLLKNRLEGTQTLSVEAQAEYYSHWLYGAMHMASTIPQLQSVAKASVHFRIEEFQARKIFEFLHLHGLVAMENGKVRPGQTHLFVGADSPMMNQQHTIWRVKVLNDLKTNASDDFHYTLCFSASESDWPILRERMVKAIEDALLIIRPSKEEKLGLLNVDFQAI